MKGREPLSKSGEPRYERPFSWPILRGPPRDRRAKRRRNPKVMGSLPLPGGEVLTYWWIVDQHIGTLPAEVGP